MTEKEFNSLFESHRISLTKYVQRYGGLTLDDADDIVQITAFKAYNYCIVRKKEIGIYFKTWIYKIAINTLSDLTRSNKIKSKKEIFFSDISKDETNEAILEYCLNMNAENNISHDILVDKDFKKELYKHIDSLKSKQPEAYETLCLHIFENKDYKECADICNVPIGTVKSRIFRAKDYLSKNIPETLKEYLTSI